MKVGTRELPSDINEIVTIVQHLDAGFDYEEFVEFALDIFWNLLRQQDRERIRSDLPPII